MYNCKITFHLYSTRKVTGANSYISFYGFLCLYRHIEADMNIERDFLGFLFCNLLNNMSCTTTQVNTCRHNSFFFFFWWWMRFVPYITFTTNATILLLIYPHLIAGFAISKYVVINIPVYTPLFIHSNIFISG